MLSASMNWIVELFPPSHNSDVTEPLRVRTYTLRFFQIKHANRKLRRFVNVRWKIINITRVCVIIVFVIKKIRFLSFSLKFSYNFLRIIKKYFVQ